MKKKAKIYKTREERYMTHDLYLLDCISKMKDNIASNISFLEMVEDSIMSTGTKESITRKKTKGKKNE